MTDIRPGSYVGTVRIDNGDPYPARLVIEQDIRIEHTNLPIPDPAWEFVDAAGHFHAYDTANELRTLSARREHRDCDGSCGDQCKGYEVTVYACRICNEVVTPRLLIGPHSFPVHGRMSWHIDLEGIDEQAAPVPVRLAKQVSARFTCTDTVWFGVAFVQHVRRDNTLLRGSGPLGRRNSRRVTSPSSA